MTELLHRGDGVLQMMQVTGEEGVTLEDYLDYQRATFVDMVYLQQDAFDPVDISMSTERQKESFTLMRRLIDRNYKFDDKEQTREYFTKLTGLYKNLNYAKWKSDEYNNLLDEINALEKAALEQSITTASDQSTPDPVHVES